MLIKKRGLPMGKNWGKRYRFRHCYCFIIFLCVCYILQPKIYYRSCLLLVPWLLFFWSTLFDSNVERLVSWFCLLACPIGLQVGLGVWKLLVYLHWNIIFLFCCLVSLEKHLFLVEVICCLGFRSMAINPYIIGES